MRKLHQLRQWVAARVAGREELGAWPSAWQMIVAVAAILILGLGGVVLAFGEEIVAWLRWLRTREDVPPANTGAFGDHVTVTLAWVQAQLFVHWG